MKNVIETDKPEGFEKYLGERVTLFCCRYIYTGKLIGVSEDKLLLTDRGIVYETGKLDDKDWKDYQKLPHDWYVQKDSIESWGVLKT